jgi:rubrerythrin
LPKQHFALRILNSITKSTIRRISEHKNLLNAIHIVTENEKIALEYYAKEAKNIDNPLGKKLFEQLSEFEKFHYEKLSALEKSLEEKGDFINYEGKVFPLPPVFEIKITKDPHRKSLMEIISVAVDLEKKAEKAYADIAAQITDSHGRQMFIRLSEEEHNHYRILKEAYWSLNDTGIWNWSPI